MDPHNMEARRLFATLHLRLGSLIPARQAFDSLIDEAFARQDYWLAESLLREYLAAGPRCVPYLEKLGSIYQDKGEVTEAVEQYGKAIDILVEDPDSDNPDHASQLYEKIKSLAPGSFAATRVAGYFDAQTGALIARPSDDAGGDFSVSDEVSDSATDLKPMAEIGPWGTTGEPLPVEEAGASLEKQEMPSGENGFAQLEEVPEAVGDMSVFDQPIGVSEAELVEAEPASTLLDDPTDFALQQTEVLDDVPQDIPPEQETAEQVAPDLMPGADVQEATLEMPSQVPMDSADALSFTSEPDQTSSSPSLDPMPWGEVQETTPEASSQTPTDSAKDFSCTSTSEPDQILPSPSPDSPKGGTFSWDSVFKNVWNKNSGSVSTASAPTMGAPHSGAILLPEPDTTEASSAGAPMPWDQVQDSTIRISPGQADEGSAESPIEEARLSGSSSETMPWVDQERVAEQDRPLSLVHSGGGTKDSQDVPMNLSVTDQALFETEPSVDVIPPGHVPGESSVEQQETESQPFSLACSGEEPTATDEAQSDPEWNPAGQSVAEEETVSTPAQYENLSCSLEGESLETPSESYADGLEQAAIPDQLPSSGHAKDGSPRIDRHISDEDDLPLQTQRQVQPEQLGKPAFVEAKAPLLEPSPQSEDGWSKPEESIRFVRDQPAVSPAGKDQKPSLWRSPIASGVEAASARSVPHDPPAGRAVQAEPREQITRPRPRRKGPGLLSRIGATISSFIGSCFSTTRAIVMSLIALAVLSCVVAALGVGAVGVTWMIMEEAPSPAYQAFTAGPQQAILDSNKNGYVFLMGFDAPAGQSPRQLGDERHAGGADGDHVQACLGSLGDGGNATNGTVPEKILSGWFRGSDPVGQFIANQGAIGRWANQGERMLGRYRQWQKLPFEDWGYGRAVAPPCAAVSFAHRLYVAEGFSQHTDIGINRLEADMEAWRIVMAQARTLPVKVLAIQAVRDDAAVASGLLARPDVDSKHVGRLSHMLRPLNQEELSIRWPMQSELVRAAKTFDIQVKAAKQEGQPLHAAVASALPLPSQRRLNSYAAYYEAANQASEEGRHGALPKLAGFIKAPASTVADYFVNPIETVIGLDPLPAWDVYNGLAVDTDAHLRLASLQAWIRRGWQDTELLSRIAKAGQTFYDPYTGLPMLVNLKKRLLYSIGHDLKDQDGDPQDDVVVAIPGNPAFLPPRTPAASSPSD